MDEGESHHFVGFFCLRGDDVMWDFPSTSLPLKVQVNRKFAYFFSIIDRKRLCDTLLMLLEMRFRIRLIIYSNQIQD